MKNLILFLTILSIGFISCKKEALPQPKENPVVVNPAEDSIPNTYNIYDTIIPPNPDMGFVGDTLTKYCGRWLFTEEDKINNTTIQYYFKASQHIVIYSYYATNYAIFDAEESGHTINRFIIEMSKYKLDSVVIHQYYHQINTYNSNVELGGWTNLTYNYNESTTSISETGVIDINKNVIVIIDRYKGKDGNWYDKHLIRTFKRVE